MLCHIPFPTSNAKIARFQAYIIIMTISIHKDQKIRIVKVQTGPIGMKKSGRRNEIRTKTKLDRGNILRTKLP